MENSIFSASDGDDDECRSRGRAQTLRLQNHQRVQTRLRHRQPDLRQLAQTRLQEQMRGNE